MSKNILGGELFANIFGIYIKCSDFSLFWLSNERKLAFRLIRLIKKRIFIIMATVNYLFMVPWFLV